MEILRTQNLSFKYPNSNTFAVNNINISVNKGELIVVCGESGCGKTTFLKLIKSELAPYGEKSGSIEIFGVRNNYEIGFVFQNPESQIVTDKVWHELAFGLENINTPSDIIRLRVGEMANYFGIADWFRKDTDKLSGGQKQLLNLASVMAMQPKILILDEPTAQLDPIAAADFISTIRRLNRDFGITVIIVEHRLEQLLPIADRVIYMENGVIAEFDKPQEVCSRLKDKKMQRALPCAVRIFNELNLEGNCPITIRDCRNLLESKFQPSEYIIEESYQNKETALTIKNVWFRYSKDDDDVLRGVNAEIYKGEFVCFVGGNGVGKTTLLNVISGIDAPYRGKIKKNKDSKIGYLTQNPLNLFVKDTLNEDLQEYCKQKHIDFEHCLILCNELEISNLLERHPRDISGGEIQKFGLTKVLLNNPAILLLDEPTKGLDAVSKDEFANIIKKLTKKGITVIAVSHDLEFAAENADRCGLFFDGEVLSIEIPQKFFSENNFYTTAASRISRELFKNTVTFNEVIENCRKQIKNNENH